MIKTGDIINNRYNILSHLGTGGMAEVFQCEDIYTNKTLAIKIMKSGVLSDEQLYKSFQKEVHLLISLSHPNILEIYDEGIYEERPYMVMEYLKNQTLLDQIEFYTKFSCKEACEIMLQLLDAVSYAHNHGLIHRDIKPQNVFYLPNGTIKLGDFGIAKREKEVEIDEKILGSIHYLAPEVLSEKFFSTSSDIYALGITFFQLVTGQLPFDGSTKEIADAQVNKRMPKASDINSSIPKEIDEIIAKAVSKNPRNRYENAAEFSTAVSNFLSGKKAKKSIFNRFF